MEQDESFEIYEGIIVPVSPLLKRERSSRYGSVSDLDDEELIDPAEIDRVFLREAFAPILALPVKNKKGGIKRDCSVVTGNTLLHSSHHEVSVLFANGLETARHAAYRQQYAG